MGRRFLSGVYEALLLWAVLWCAGLLYELLEVALGRPHARGVFQAYLLVVAGAYFISQWIRGATLAMKTWRLRVLGQDGTPLTLRQATMRFLVALAGTASCGVGFLWAFIDRDGLFLHDRVCRTRIVHLADEPAPARAP